jgi:hypothetical protein
VVGFASYYYACEGNWNWSLRVLLHSNSGVVRQRRIAQYLRRGEATTDCTVPQALVKYALGLRLFRACAGRESPLSLAMTEAISGACWGLKD